MTPVAAILLNDASTKGAPVHLEIHASSRCLCSDVMAPSIKAGMLGSAKIITYQMCATRNVFTSKLFATQEYMVKLEHRQIGQWFCLRKCSPGTQFWLAAQNQAPTARGWLRSVLLNDPSGRPPRKGLAIQLRRVPFSVRRRVGATCPHAAIPGRVTMRRIPGIIRERGSGVLHGQIGDSTDRPAVLFTKI
jgi:hypothetical protein